MACLIALQRKHIVLSSYVYHVTFPLSAMFVMSVNRSRIFLRIKVPTIDIHRDSQRVNFFLIDGESSSKTHQKLRRTHQPTSISRKINPETFRFPIRFSPIFSYHRQRDPFRFTSGQEAVALYQRFELIG